MFLKKHLKLIKQIKITIIAGNFNIINLVSHGTNQARINNSAEPFP